MAPRRRPFRQVTLASDIGSAYAAQMKAVLLRHLAPERVIDLTHELRAHAVREAAFVLRPVLARWPSGAVHVVVVDPGVGGRRAPIALRCADASVLIGPDNGVLPPLARERGGGSAYRIDPRRLSAGPRVGTTFDGRDLFAPAAVAVATGTPAAKLGPRVVPVELEGPAPERGARGSVAHVDRFGNLVSDVPTAWVPAATTRLRVRLGRRSLDVPFVRSYEEGGRGRLLVLGSSFGTLELSVAEGRALERLRASVGARLRFGWGGRERSPKP